MQLMALFDSQEVKSARRFKFVANPNITGVSPKKGIVSGGIKVTVKGTNLSVVQKAVMKFRQMTGTRRKRSVREYSGVCLIFSLFSIRRKSIPLLLEILKRKRKFSVVLMLPMVSYAQKSEILNPY